MFAPPLAYHLLFAYGDYRDQVAESFFARGQDWQFLVPVVLDGMRNASSIMVPAALAAFFKELPMSGEAGSPEGFRDGLLSDFFGRQVNDFFSLAAGFDPALAPLKENAFKQLVLGVNAAKARVLPGASPQSSPNTTGVDVAGHESSIVPQ
jgi:hypothetical protein